MLVRTGEASGASRYAHVAWLRAHKRKTCHHSEFSEASQAPSRASALTRGQPFVAQASGASSTWIAAWAVASDSQSPFPLHQLEACESGDGVGDGTSEAVIVEQAAAQAGQRAWAAEE